MACWEQQRVVRGEIKQLDDQNTVIVSHSQGAEWMIINILLPNYRTPLHITGVCYSKLSVKIGDGGYWSRSMREDNTSYFSYKGLLNILIVIVLKISLHQYPDAHLYVYSYLSLWDWLLLPIGGYHFYKHSYQILQCLGLLFF